MVTGGTLKPKKCFAYLISYRWCQNGDWFDKANKSLPEFGLNVSLPGGRREAIEHTPAQTGKETFDVFSYPSGDATLALQALHDNTSDEWCTLRRGVQAARTSGCC